jgi:hypothetical protein
MVTGFVLSLVTVSSLKAQEPIVKTQQTTTWDAKKNPTVDSISAKYQGRLIAAKPALTTADIFPVVGNYTSASTAGTVDVAATTTTTTTAVDVSNVVITLDEQNKGIVWIEGLPQGRIKAQLRQSPATYKIPEQKTEDGKEVKEGVLIYDAAANLLNVCIGCEFKSDNPALAFDQTAVVEEPEVKVKTKSAKTKSKTVVKAKPFYFSGTKVIETTASTTESIQQ